MLIFLPECFEIVDRELRTRVLIKDSDNHLTAIVRIPFYEVNDFEPDMQQLQKLFAMFTIKLPGCYHAVDWRGAEVDPAYQFQHALFPGTRPLRYPANIRVTRSYQKRG